MTRTGWTSEVGYEIYLTDSTRGTELWETLMEVGAPYGVRPTGPSDIRRIEGGIFNWGADMTYEHNAFEMGLERLVDFGLADDACISIAAYRRIKDAGVDAADRRRRARRRAVPGAQQREVAGVRGRRRGAAESGCVTSAIYSPRLERNIGVLLGAVELSRARARGCRSRRSGGPARATVVPMPFVDPEKRIPIS